MAVLGFYFEKSSNFALSNVVMPQIWKEIEIVLIDRIEPLDIFTELIITTKLQEGTVLIMQMSLP